MIGEYWLTSAYIVIIFDGEELRYDKRDDDGRMLAVDFDVKHTNGKEPSVGNFAIYNLTEETRKRIASDAVGIRFYGGYEGNEKLLYSGSIEKVFNKRQGNDIQTELRCGDGFREFTKSVTSKTYASGATKEEIVSNIAKDMGLGLKVAKGALTGVMNGSKTLDGLSKDVLSEIVPNWSIVDGEINISGSAVTPMSDDAVLIKSDTGLLESPTITEKGVNVKAQIDPDIRPRSLLKVESMTVNGLFVVQSVQFVGNNYGGAFDMNIEAIAND
jgi:hypothetical protein